MARRRPLSRCLEAFAVLCLAGDSRDAAAAPTVVESHAAAINDTRATIRGKSPKLASRTSLEVPRGAEGIRRRLAETEAGISSVDGGLEVEKARAHHDSLESQDHASWIGIFTSPADTCRLDEDDLRTYHGSGENAQCEGFTSATRGEEARDGPHPPPPTEDDFGEFGRHPVPSGQSDLYGEEQDSSSSRTESKGNKSSVRQDCLGVSVKDRGTSESREALSDPGLDHDPWEGYEIIAQADPVASWEILREVCTRLPNDPLQRPRTLHTHGPRYLKQRAFLL